MCRAYLFQRTEGLEKTHTCARVFKKKRGGWWYTRKHTSKSLSCPLQAASTTVTQDPDLNVTDLAPLVFECASYCVWRASCGYAPTISEKKSQSSLCAFSFFKNLLVSRGFRALGDKYSVPHDLDSITWISQCRKCNAGCFSGGPGAQQQCYTMMH